MTVLVCGGRDFADYQWLARVLDEVGITRLVHGGARGADKLAGKWGRERNVLTIVYEAAWGRYGKSAGARRNQQMLDEERVELVVAFPGGRGTADMVRRATRAGVRVLRVQGVESDE